MHYIHAFVKKRVHITIQHLKFCFIFTKKWKIWEIDVNKFNFPQWRSVVSVAQGEGHTRRNLQKNTALKAITLLKISIVILQNIFAVFVLEKKRCFDSCIGTIEGTTRSIVGCNNESKLTARFWNWLLILALDCTLNSFKKMTKFY